MVPYLHGTAQHGTAWHSMAWLVVPRQGWEAAGGSRSTQAARIRRAASFHSLTSTLGSRCPLQPRSREFASLIFSFREVVSLGQMKQLVGPAAAQSLEQATGLQWGQGLSHGCRSRTGSWCQAAAHQDLDLLPGAKDRESSRISPPGTRTKAGAPWGCH